MSNPWTILYLGDERTPEAWGIQNLRRARVSLEQSKLTFDQPAGAADGDPLFAFEGIVTLKKDGVVWFTGKCLEPSRKAAAAGEGLSYEVVDLWYDLENCAFQQIWQVTDGVTSSLIDASRSMVIVNQNTDGSKMDTGAAITAALNYAISCGANFQVGTIGVSATIPFVQLKDLPVSEIVRQMLRWTPDAAAWVDYTTTLDGAPCPTFHITRRGDAGAVTKAVFGFENSNSLNLRARRDLLVPAVVLKYTQNDAIDGVTYLSQTVDKYPADASGTALKTMVGDLPIQGFRGTTLKQYLKTAAMDPTDPTWWQAVMPALRSSTGATIDPTSIVIADGALELSPEAIAASKTSADFPNYIIAGAQPAWLPNTTFRVTARANVSYISTDADGNARIVGPTPMSVNVQGTSLGPVDATYSFFNIEETAEEVPSGLAEQIYAAVSVLQFEGVLVAIAEECPGDIGPANVLNLSDGRTEWATMNAQVQRVEEFLDEGRTEITIGPAKHLGGADLLELWRAVRNWSPTISRNERVTGTPSGMASAKGSIPQAGEGFSAAPDLPGVAMVVGTGGAAKTVTVTPKDVSAVPAPLSADQAVKLREVPVCVPDGSGGTVEKKMLILASDYYT